MERDKVKRVFQQKKERYLSQKRTELIHGIRNIIHNALKFSNSSVDINLIVTSRKINLEIIDDGQGFPYDVENFISEPFVKKSDFNSIEARTNTSEEGMGLGLFIANILLGRTKGKLKFSNVQKIENNGNKRITGAKVEISWDRVAIEVLQGDNNEKLKENPRNVS